MNNISKIALALMPASLIATSFFGMRWVLEGYAATAAAQQSSAAVLASTVGILLALPSVLKWGGLAALMVGGAVSIARMGFALSRSVEVYVEGIRDVQKVNACIRLAGGDSVLARRLLAAGYVVIDAPPGSTLGTPHGSNGSVSSDPDPGTDLDPPAPSTGDRDESEDEPLLSAATRAKLRSGRQRPVRQPDGQRSKVAGVDWPGSGLSP